MYSTYDSNNHSSEQHKDGIAVDESQRYFNQHKMLNSATVKSSCDSNLNSNSNSSSSSSGHKKYTKINDGFILKSDQLTTRLDVVGHKGQYEHNGNRYNTGSCSSSSSKSNSIANCNQQYRTSNHSINTNSSYGYMLPPPILTNVNNNSSDSAIGDESVYGYNSYNDHHSIYGTSSNDSHLYSSLYESTSKANSSHHHDHHAIHGKYSSATSTPIAIPSGSGTMKHRRHGLSRSSPGTPLASVPHQLSTSSGGHSSQSYSLYSSPAYSASSTSKSTSYLVPPLGPTGRPVNGTSDLSIPGAVGGSGTSTNAPLQLPHSSAAHAMYGQTTSSHQRSNGHRTSHYYHSSVNSNNAAPTDHYDHITAAAAAYGTVRHSSRSSSNQLNSYGCTSNSNSNLREKTSSHEHSSKLRSVSRDRNTILNEATCNQGQTIYQSKSSLGSNYLEQVPQISTDSIYESIDTLVNQLISQQQQQQQQQPLYSHLPKEAKIDHHQGYHHSSSSNYHQSSAYSSHAGSIYSTASDSILGNGHHRDLVTNTSNTSNTLSRRSRSTSRHRKSVTDEHNTNSIANLPLSSTSLHPESLYGHNKCDLSSELNDFIYSSNSNNNSKSNSKSLYGQVMSNQSQTTSIPDVLSNTGLIDSLTSTNLSLPSTSMTSNSLGTSSFTKYGYTNSKGKQQQAQTTYHQVQGSTPAVDIQCHNQEENHDGYHTYSHYSSSNNYDSGKVTTSTSTNPGGVNAASIYATIKKAKSTSVTTATLSSLSVPSLDQVMMDLNRDSVYASHGDPMASASAVTSTTSTTIQLPTNGPSVATVSSTPSSLVMAGALMSTSLNQSYVPPSSQCERQQNQQQQQSQSQQQNQQQQQPLTSSTCNSGHHHALGHTSTSNRSSTSISFVTRSSPAESFSSSAESASDSSSESNSSSPSTPSTSPCSSRGSSRSNSPDGGRHHSMSTNSAHHSGHHHNFDPKSQLNHLTNYLSSALTSVKSSFKHPSLVNQFKQLKMTSMSAVINSIVNNVTTNQTDHDNGSNGLGSNNNGSPLTSITPINTSSPMLSTGQFAIAPTSITTTTGHPIVSHEHISSAYGQVDSHHHGQHRHHKHRSHHGKEKMNQIVNHSVGYNESDYSGIGNPSIDQGTVNGLNHTDHDQVICNLINNDHHHNNNSNSNGTVSRKSRSKSSHRSSSSSKFIGKGGVGGEYTVNSIVDVQLSNGDNEVHSTGQMAIDVLEAIQNNPSDCSSNSSYSCHNGGNNCHHQSHNYHRRSNHQIHQAHNPSSDSSTSGYITGATDHSGSSSNNGDDASVSGGINKSNYHHQIHHGASSQSHRSTHYGQFNKHELSLQIDSQAVQSTTQTNVKDDISNSNGITTVDLPSNSLHVPLASVNDSLAFGHRERSKSREHLTSRDVVTSRSHSKSSKHKSRSKSKSHHQHSANSHGESHRRCHTKKSSKSGGGSSHHQSKSSQSGNHHHHHHRRHRHSSSNQINCCIKYTLFTVNTLSWLIGFILLMVGIWAWNEKDYFSNVFNVPVITLDPAFALMFIGLITFAIGFIGSIGSLRENTTLLAVYSILLLILLFSELTLSIFAFAFKDWVS